MIDFMSKFYDKLPIKPDDIDFVETYGSANKNIDEKELEAIEKVYCKNRKNPLLIGAVKPNTGHSEASSAMFSIAKVLIAMEQGIIPATIQHENPNPNIRGLFNGNLEIVTKNRPWNPTYAAVNGIGIDSYYGHILLKANPKNKFNPSQFDGIPRLAIASTRTEEGIKDILDRYKNKCDDLEFIQLSQDLFTKPILGHLYRGYTLVGLERPTPKIEYHQGTKRPIWFVFSGMGSQWNGMVGDLMKLPIFADSIQRSHNVLKSKGVDLLHIISSDDKTIFENILHSFVGIAAIQIALTDILKAVGIVPDGIIGHSVGELGCAYADGCVTAEQMILSAYSRGIASLEAELIPGMMAAIGVGYNTIKSKLPPTIEVACHNGPDSATLSGPREDMEKFVAELQAQGIFARLVNVSNIAYHSQYIKPAAPLLLKYLKNVIPEPVKRSPKWISTSNLEDKWNTELAQYSSADYHTNNLLSSVYFEEGLRHIPKDSILIEIAPHGLLQAILKRSLKSGCINIALTQRSCASGLEYLLNALGKMYLAGMDLSVGNIYPRIEYPVGRGTRSLAPLAHWNHSEVWRTGLEAKLHSLFSVNDMQVTLNSEEFRECVGHQLDDNIILPASFYLNIAYQLIANITSERKEIVFEDLHFRKTLIIPKIGSVPLHGMVQKGSGKFEITSNKEIIVTGKMTFPQPTEQYMLESTKIEVGDDHVDLSGSDVYNELQHRGHKYAGLFKAIKNLTLLEKGSVANIQWNNKWTMFLEAMIQQQCLHSGEKYQDIYVPKTIQKICIDQKLLPTEKTDLRVDYEYSTRILSTEGLQLIGMNAAPLERETKKSYLDTIEYIPLNGSEFENMETGICVALQLMLENFADQYITNVMITEVTGDEPLLEYINSALSQYGRLNPNIVTVKEVKQIVVQSAYPLLIVQNAPLSEEVAKIVSYSHAFLLVKTDKNVLSYSNIVEVMNFSCKGQSYSVLRKANIDDVTVVPIKNDVLTIKDLKRSSLTWVSELIKATESSNNIIFLISTVIPLEGFTSFVQELKTQPNMDKVRIIVNLDKNSNINLKDLYKKDLVLSIIKDGTVNVYLPIPVKVRGTAIQNTMHCNIPRNRTINYLGLNLVDVTLNPATEKPVELNNLDYSGTLNKGQKIMGLVSLDKDTSSLVFDPVLNWPLPEHWNIEDGAASPYAYAIAYYILFIKGEIKPGETVLIHAGASAIGIAAISIAISVNCTVYTTVSNDKQSEYLRSKFRKLREGQIFSSENASFEPYLMMATGGRGADIIVNCLSGSLLQCSLACIADYGRFLQIGKYDLEENNSIGMYCFLRNVSFYAVNLDLISQPDEIKQEVKKLVQEGLDSRLIVPIWRVVYNHHDIRVILNNLKKSSNIGKAVIALNTNVPLSKLNVKKPNQFICDPKASYLVYGGSADQWTDITEWLVTRGAKKIVVSADSKPQQNHINRRLSLLQSYFECDIIFAPNKVHTKEGAAELLSEVYFLGPIHAVFLLPQVKSSSTSKVSDIKPVQYIDNALRTTAPKALFINFINSAAGICQLRADAGYPIYNIQWLKELELGDALLSLDNILSIKAKNILINNDKLNDSKQETTQALFKKLTQMLPNSIEKLTEQTKDAPDEPDIIQLITEGPQEIRELIPLFIIPGLNTESEIEELASHLLMPSFCGILPRTPTTLKELAEKFVEKIRAIWSVGPYNILAISWGGVLATEIAKILDKDYNSKVYLFYIDGAPSTLQAAIQLLGEKTDMEVNLLARVFNSNDAQTLKKLQTDPDWESKVNNLINSYKGNLEDKDALKDGLLTLRDRLRQIIEYKPGNTLVGGSSYLIRPGDCSQYDNCELTLYLKQTPQVHLVTGDHITIIRNKDTAEYINEMFQLT
ncbi:hypothetical protein ABEB36_003705 [Hypothenemus hampei]|uniref:Uncharacterized protein n=1 Tax=Hypothenemus hampei TaxID=57062 RepID=A0ABD1F0W7_HYPHA